MLALDLNKSLQYLLRNYEWKYIEGSIINIIDIEDHDSDEIAQSW